MDDFVIIKAPEKLLYQLSKLNFGITAPIILIPLEAELLTGALAKEELTRLHKLIHEIEG